MPRKYSDAFIEQQITKVDAIQERIQQDTVLYPSCLMPADSDPRFPPYGRGLSEPDRAAVKKYFKQLRDMAYVQGFWIGWATREGSQ